MEHRDVVVIGASAGGIQALVEIVGKLPSDFPGIIFVVVHVPPTVSKLPAILSRAGALPAIHALQREPILPGRIVVAPPDYHLLVRANWIELSHGPRENHHRPAVDPTFRTAARAFGRRVIGIVLSGALGDGATGLLAVKARGGVAIVQDPDDAINESMPRSALQLVDVDYVLPASEIGQKLVEMIERPLTGVGAMAMANEFERTTETISDDFAEQGRDQRVDELTPFTCPDCGGSLWQFDEANVLRFQCHVGHTYEGETLLGQKSEEVEAALWSSMRLLKERATLTRQVASRLRGSGERARAAMIEDQALLDEEHVRSLRGLLESNVDPLAAPVLRSGTFEDRQMD